MWDVPLKSKEAMIAVVLAVATHWRVQQLVAIKIEYTQKNPDFLVLKTWGRS